MNLDSARRMTDKLWRCPCFTWSKIPCYWTELSFQAQAEEIVSLPTIDATPSWEWDASKLFQDDLTVSFIKPSMCRLPLFTDARASFFIWQWGLERGPYAASGGAGMPFFFSPLPLDGKIIPLSLWKIFPFENSPAHVFFLWPRT